MKNTFGVKSALKKNFVEARKTKTLVDFLVTENERFKLNLTFKPVK